MCNKFGNIDLDDSVYCANGNKSEDADEDICASNEDVIEDLPKQKTPKIWISKSASMEHDLD